MTTRAVDLVRASQWRRLGPPSLLVVIVVWTLFPATSLYFYSDDFCWLAASARAAAEIEPTLPADVNGHFRPLAELQWLVGYRLFGLDASRFHGLTLGLHVLATLAVAWLCARMVGGSTATTIGGLAFGVCFAHRSVPLWLSASPDLLLGLFGAIGLAAVVGAPRRPLVAVVSFALALLAKESALPLLAVLPLLSWQFCRDGWARWLLLAVTIGLAIPHVIAALLSVYAVSRFSVGPHLVSNLLALMSGLTVPWVGEGGGSLSTTFGERSPLRLTVGLGAFVLVLMLASARLGKRRVGTWGIALVVILLVPALANGELEPRWLYLPWVVFSPVVAAAGCRLLDLFAAQFGRKLAVGIMGLFVTCQLVVNGYAMRSKIAQANTRDAWTRSVIEAATTYPKSLSAGDVVEVVVTAGSDLRYWPLGIEVAIGVPLQVRPVAVQSADGNWVLDATELPPAWSRQASPQPAD